jgi:hypothetical protein
MKTPIHRYRALLACITLVAVAGCSSSSAPIGDEGPTRGFRMGFSGIPPRANLDQAIAAIAMWSERADAAIMSFELPWDSLLAGVAPETLVVRDQLGLANYYRALGHEVTVYLDPANGLDRAGESGALVAAGRSIAEPAIQQMFRRYAVVIDSIVQPRHLGLALETNLIRGLASAQLYAAVRQVANDAASDVRAVDANVALSVSVQVDWAWGRLGGGNVYEGVEQDFIDFPFIDELGMSSYPYLGGFDAPEDIPLDYYSRIVQGHSIAVMVTEGGWSSVTLGPFVSSADEQRRYILRHRELLDTVGAVAVFQLVFTDLDVDESSEVWPFARLGLVDVDLAPKPALSPWDDTFTRPYRP